MISTSLIMGFFKIPNIMSKEGRPMPKTDLKLLTVSVFATLISLFIGLKYVPNKTNYAKGLMIQWHWVQIVITSSRVIMIPISPTPHLLSV